MLSVQIKDLHSLPLVCGQPSFITFTLPIIAFSRSRVTSPIYPWPKTGLGKLLRYITSLLLEEHRMKQPNRSLCKPFRSCSNFLIVKSPSCLSLPVHKINLKRKAFSNGLPFTSWNRPHTDRYVPSCDTEHMGQCTQAFTLISRCFPCLVF